MVSFNSVVHAVWRRAALLRLLAAMSAAVLLPAQTASVSGTVVNDATGAPLHMALVTMTTTGPKPMEASVYTDSHGAFTFQAPPGSYYLAADENGYEHTFFGAPTPDRAAAVMRLHAGETRQGIQLRLRPFAAISGVVVDQDNDPIPYVHVSAVVPTIERGKHTYQVRNGAGTNARGEFRIHQLLPGRYYLMANGERIQATTVRPVVAVNESAPQMVYAPAYYPGVTRIEDATAIDVRAAVEVRDIVVHMEARQTATVHGRVQLPEGVTAAGGLMVQFQPTGLVSPENLIGQGVGADGTFGPINLIPGSYRVNAQASGEIGYRGVQDVELQPGPQEITVAVSRGVAISGRLVLEGPNAGDLAREQVSLFPAEKMMAPLTEAVKADGSFQFPNVFPGVWDIGVSPIPKGGFVKSMMLGDQDVLTEEMAIGPDTSQALNIVVSSRGGVVSGTVEQPEDPLADLTGHERPRILLAPAGKFADVLSFFEFTAADENGHYELTGITPGEYKLYAFEQLELGAWRDPDFMKRLASAGKPVTVHEGDHLTVDTEVMPLPPGGAR